jgi:microcystin-dependent protein
MDNLFTEGDPINGVPATTVSGAWLNAVQEEIANAIEAFGAVLDKPNNAQLAAILQAISTPSGAVAPFARSTAPSGWLACSGQAVSRATYAALFAAIGTTFGAGNGTTTFNVPDLRGEFIRGLDGGRGVDVGRIFGSAQTEGLQRHNHYIPTGTDNTAVDPGPSIPDINWVTNKTVNVFPTPGTVAVTVDANGVQNGPSAPGIVGAWASETRPRNIALLYCIKF